MEMRGLRGTGHPVGQHDGLFFSLNEECAMFQKGLGRDKIVEIHVRCVADQLLEAVERADGSHGHHPFDKSPQPHAGQCIGVYYGYFGGWFHVCRMYSEAKLLKLFI